MKSHETYSVAVNTILYEIYLFFILCMVKDKWINFTIFYERRTSLMYICMCVQLTIITSCNEIRAHVRFVRFDRFKYQVLFARFSDVSSLIAMSSPPPQSYSHIYHAHHCIPKNYPCESLLVKCIISSHHAAIGLHIACHKVTLLPSCISHVWHF